MFLTGEFSKIARVSKRLLQYYDKIDLLKPAKTDPQTGYRYYSAKQLPRLNRILALKELGLSLDQIARFLDDNVSEEEIHGMLLMQQAELEKQILGDLQRFRRIESRLKQLDNPDVVLKSVPELSYLASRVRVKDASHGWESIQKIVRALPSQSTNVMPSRFMAIIHAEEHTFEDVDIDFGYLLAEHRASELTLDEMQFSTTRLPALDIVASIMHVGGPDVSMVGYGALGTWIESNGYEIIGLQREIFINLHEFPEQEDLVMEIQFPVRKRPVENELLTNLLNE